MPYNNSAIPPTEEITGTAALPLARVKKIINLDEDIAQCSNNAAFVITVATEMFIRYLAEQAHNVVKSERKPRRNIQYRDLATAVSRIDNLEFLSDVIPKTTTYRQFKEKKAKEASEQVVEAGQTRLGNVASARNGINGDRADNKDRMTGVDEGDRAIRVTDLLGPTTGDYMMDKTAPSSGQAYPSHDGDVEMQ